MKYLHPVSGDISKGLPHHLFPIGDLSQSIYTGYTGPKYTHPTFQTGGGSRGGVGAGFPYGVLVSVWD